MYWYQYQYQLFLGFTEILFFWEHSQIGWFFSPNGWFLDDIFIPSLLINFENSNVPCSLFAILISLFPVVNWQNHKSTKAKMIHYTYREDISVVSLINTQKSMQKKEERNLLSNTSEIISEHGHPLPHQRYLLRYNWRQHRNHLLWWLNYL